MNKRNHSDYTQLAIHVPKDLAKNFKQLALELELGQSEAGEQAIKMWCETTIQKLNSNSDK